MAALAELYSVDLAHHEEPQVAAHLLASQPRGTYLEWPASGLSGTCRSVS
jgi:D-galactarolactone cycloisomerase